MCPSRATPTNRPPPETREPLRTGCERCGACEESGSSELTPFPRRFRYVGCLGVGAQGAAHLCDDRMEPGCRVVVKIARPGRDAEETLEREARALWSLRGVGSSPELRCLLYREGRLSGIVTRYARGWTLERYIEEVSVARRPVLALAAATCRAVFAVARRGWIHRDVKPENLLVVPSGRVQLFDFGLACRTGQGVARGEVSGTFAYASPEQLEARALDRRSDLFSLGLVLYEIATGRRFFTPAEVGYRGFVEHRAHRLSLPIDLEGVDADLARLIRRLVVADRGRRAGVVELARAIQALERRVRARRRDGRRAPRAVRSA